MHLLWLFSLTLPLYEHKKRPSYIRNMLHFYINLKPITYSVWYGLFSYFKFRMRLLNYSRTSQMFLTIYCYLELELTQATYNDLSQSLMMNKARLGISCDQIQY